ncbi:hypothetical protein AN639_01355 [Candidatus Epulonipiscium fishelsonii]|uniref:Uncharacterized protein n=1 Tax=Candidatus Epulonipiscium fishelsonii TaxID=77094 RepID=A0ACC8XBV3_9FIRM|nr:hypothetical protein AN639_01355 [Epulopiscium sp. SCG-B05WGA-EpuloA1]ONI40024.1 hypothetical protein AN396_06650 [Epulopiscium sp. SCG-B11WGA-EpuloA1]
MNISAVLHEPKSRYSYIYDEDILHLRIKTGLGEVKKITVKAVDPFNWIQTDTEKFEFDYTTMQEIEMIYEGETLTHDVWFAEISGIKTKRIRYCFIIEDMLGNTYFYSPSKKCIVDKDDPIIDNNFLYFNFPYLNSEDIYKSPDWVKDTIWYQLTVSCYSTDGETPKNKELGNFKGLIEKLDYIKDLGCNALYLTPIFKGYSWHLYDTEDYFKVDDRLGTEEDFKEFVNKAHSLGIRVMLDAVFNHCGATHSFWQDVLKNGKNSIYYDCFYILDENKPILKEGIKIEADGSYKDVGDYDNNFYCFGYTTFMPKMNTNNPIMREYLLDVSKHWIEKFGIDGWRLDVSNEVSHDFWRLFRKTVKSVNKDVFIMGENWDDSYPWLMGDQFDAVMNYGVMANAVGLVAEPSKHVTIKYTPSEYKKAVYELMTKYPNGVTESLFNLVTSHDVERLLDICGDNKDKLKLCYLLMFTYCGAPCVYYGDEIGLTAKGDSRIPMIWDEDKQDLNLRKFFKKIIELRKNHVSFKSMKFEWLLTDDANNVLIYKKISTDDVTIIIVNNSDNNQLITLPAILQNQKFVDIFNDTQVQLDKTLSMAENSFYIFKEH